MFTVLIKDEPSNGAGSPPPGTARVPDVPPGQSSAPTTVGEDAGMLPSHDAAQVEFVFPQKDASISPGDDVVVSGTVRGLGGNTLWILSWHEDGGSFYQISGVEGISPVTTKDGPWSVTDENVGNRSDKGRAIVYFAVQANVECTKLLSSKHDPFREMPKGCITLPDQRGVKVK